MATGMKGWKFMTWLDKNKGQLKSMLFLSFALFVFTYTLTHLNITAASFDPVQAVSISVAAAAASTAAFKLLVDSTDYGLTKNPR